MPAPNTPTKKIFLSYKSSDRKDKESAAQIKKVLESVSKEAVEVFVSDESIHAGEQWRKIIRRELSDSDYLVFLYTDRFAHWEWCHFEAGLFLRAHEADDEEKEKQKIFCIYPGSMRGDPPSPLGDFQHVKLPDDTERLKRFLIELFVGEDPIRQLWLHSNSDRIGRMAKDISDVVERMAVTSLSLCRYITLRGKTPPVLKTPKDDEPTAQTIPDSYVVEADEVSLQDLFGKSGISKSGGPWTWKEVKPTGQHLWISELATSMARYILDESKPHPIRSSFKSATRRDYHPVLSEVNRRPDEYSFEVLFLEQTWEGGRRTDAVSSFKELVERLIELIKSTDEGDTTRFLANTPAVGFLAETGELWEKLRDSIEQKADQIEMICLNDEDLVRWHGLFLGKKTARAVGQIDADLVQKANQVSTSLISRLADQGRPPVRRPFTELPGFYLFKNSKRALIVAPVGAPLLRSTHAQRLNSDVRESKVEMFGLDTNVPQIVKNAGLTFGGFR